MGGFPASLGVGVGYHHPPTHWREPVGARQWSNPAAAATHWVVLRPAIAPSAWLVFFTTQDRYEPICGGPRCPCHWVASRGTRASECPVPPPLAWGDSLYAFPPLVACWCACFSRGVPGHAGSANSLDPRLSCPTYPCQVSSEAEQLISFPGGGRAW